jgi:hypothetical protein
MKDQEKKQCLSSILEIVSSITEENIDIAETLINSLGLKNEFIDLLDKEIQSNEKKMSFITFPDVGSNLTDLFKISVTKEENGSELQKICRTTLRLKIFKLILTNQ